MSPYCSECGNEIDENAKFCKFCGTQITKKNGFKKVDQKNYSDFFRKAILLLAMIAIIIISAITVYEKQNEKQNVTKVNETTKVNPNIVNSLPKDTTGVGNNEITNSIAMKFILIPAGDFDMGSPETEKGRKSDEGPVHRVNITKAFYMGQYEVTQKQWFDIMGNNPSIFKGDDEPVENISWYDVQEFIKKLNQKEGTNKYRLPSESEWEYAARAGTITKFSFGDDESKLGEYAWYTANSDGKTHPVGQKKPNPWGLYDIHGNAWEWVQDNYDTSYKSHPTDGSAWENGFTRVNRGGSYYGEEGAGLWRSADRDFDVPDQRWDDLGFRLLKDS